MPVMMRIVSLSVLSVWALAAGLAADDVVSRPNVVLVIADDMGYGDLGVTGNPVIQTPHLDAMARRSAWMTQFYVSPVCAPTRACLMTGRYNYRTRCIDTYIGRAMMEPDEVTIAEMLRDAGYATAIFGKWHLGDCYPMRAIDQGFDEALVHRGGGIGQPSDPPEGENQYTDPVLFRNGVKEPQKGYCTDVYYDNALDFIDRMHQAGRPFFVYLPDNCPHSPFHDVPEDLYAMYRDMPMDNSRFPQDKGHPLPQRHDQDKRARIYAMISNIDRNVGRLFQRLKALSLTKNTIVLFMVDNGPNTRRYVAGMKGAKAQVYEGGIRSPLFVHWPAALGADRRCERIAAHIDIVPTLVDACGAEVPAHVELDGRNLLPLLQGRDTTWPDRTLFIQSHRGNRPVPYHNFAARSQRWKLLHASGFGRQSFEGPPALELYDMRNDPLETANVAQRHPAVVRRMREAYEAWLTDVSSTRPDNYAPPRIHIGTSHEPVTVLTRQDWRHTAGRPWSRDSQGHWLLHATVTDDYRVACRFAPAGREAVAQLRVDGPSDVRLQMPLPEGASQCVFKNVPLGEGPVRLEVVLREAGNVRGIHQADVSRAN